MTDKEKLEWYQHELLVAGRKLQDLAGQLAEKSWHTGTPTEEGWYLVKYICICEGRYKGRLSYRAVHRYKDDLYDGFFYEDGGINADDIWKPIEWQKIEEN